MEYYAGIDGGGTKIEGVIADEQGHIVSHCITKGGSPLDIGWDEAIKNLECHLSMLMTDAGVEIKSLFAGMAANRCMGDYYSKTVGKKLEIPYIAFDVDGILLISAMLGHDDGCGLISGTGSSLGIRRKGYPYEFIGGKGYLIDTGGSGFELGRGAISMAFRSVEGRISHSILEELVSEKMGCPVSGWLRKIYDINLGGRAFISSFAPLVFEAYRQGDEAATYVFENNSSELAGLIAAASKRFSGDFPVVLGGGIIQNFPEYEDAIRRKSPQGAKLVKLNLPPVYGALVEALYNCGKVSTEEFRRNFAKDLAKFT